MRLYHSDRSFDCITVSTVSIDTCFFRYLTPKKTYWCKHEECKHFISMCYTSMMQIWRKFTYVIPCLLTKAWHFRLKNFLPLKNTNWHTIIFSFKCLKLIYQNQEKDSNTFHWNLFHDLFQQRYRKIVKNISCRQLFNTKFEKLNWI